MDENFKFTYTATINNRYFYNGRDSWPAWVVFIIRVAILVVGFTSLLGFEDNSIAIRSINDSVFQAKAVLISFFLLCVIVCDLVSIIPVSSWLSLNRRHGIMFALHICQIILSCCASGVYGGYVSTLALLISYVNIDYRHPRILWDDMKTRMAWGGESDQKKDQKWKLRTVTNLLKSLLGIFFGVLLIALVKSAISGSDTGSLPTETSTPHVYFKPAICAMNIGGLGIYEYSLIANAAYDDNPKLSPLDWANIPYLANFTAGEADSNPSNSSSFIEYWAPFPSNITIISIRGTKNPNDVFQDLYLYASSLSLQISSYFGTFIQLWPRNAVAALVSVISKLGRNGLTLSYWDSVGTRVISLQSRNRTVIVVGHSLGGSIAGIVGAKLQIPAIGFSAPGLGYQTATYNFTKYKKF